MSSSTANTITPLRDDGMEEALPVVEAIAIPQHHHQQDLEDQQLPPVNRGIRIGFFLYLLSMALIFGFVLYWVTGGSVNMGLAIFLVANVGGGGLVTTAVVGAVHTKLRWIHLTTRDKIMGLVPGVTLLALVIWLIVWISGP